MKSFFLWSLFAICAVVIGTLAHPNDAVAATGAISALPFLAFGTVSLFETRTMLDMIQQMKPAKRFLLDTFFKGEKTFTSEYVDIDIIKGKRRMAPFVSPIMAGKVVERLGRSTSSYKPPYIKPKMATTANDILKFRQAGSTIYAGNQTPIQAAAAQLGTDLNDMLTMIVRREEWMAAQALNGGVVAIKGDGVDDSIDFQMAPSHKITLTGTALWTDTANSNPVKDLSDWSILCAKDAGIVPDTCILGATAAAAFLNHPLVKGNDGLFNKLRLNMGQINISFLQDQGVTFIGDISYLGLNVALYSYHEWYIDDTTQTETPMIPDNKVIMGASNAQNTKLYGAIKDKVMAAMPRFPKTWEEEDPYVQWLMVQSAPLIALNQPDAFIAAQVTA